MASSSDESESYEEFQRMSKAMNGIPKPSTVKSVVQLRNCERWQIAIEKPGVKELERERKTEEDVQKEQTDNTSQGNGFWSMRVATNIPKEYISMATVNVSYPNWPIESTHNSLFKQQDGGTMVHL